MSMHEHQFTLVWEWHGGYIILTINLRRQESCCCIHRVLGHLLLQHKIGKCTIFVPPLHHHILIKLTKFPFLVYTVLNFEIKQVISNLKSALWSLGIQLQIICLDRELLFWLKCQLRLLSFG